MTEEQGQKHYLVYTIKNFRDNRSIDFAKLFTNPKQAYEFHNEMNRRAEEYHTAFLKWHREGNAIMFEFMNANREAVLPSWPIQEGPDKIAINKSVFCDPHDPAHNEYIFANILDRDLFKGELPNLSPCPSPEGIIFGTQVIKLSSE